MIGWIIGIVVVLLIVCWVIGTYNGLIKGRIVVDEAFATMDKVVEATRLAKEQYPDLKANQNFMDLSHNLNETEDDIANARKYYNGAVKQYNMKVQMFPGSLIAGLFHFETKKMFEVENAVERQNVQVKF